MGAEPARPVVFTSGQVQQLTGVCQHDLTYWDRSGLVRPTGRAGRGRGSRRLYTTLDVLQIKVIRRLRDAGLSLQKIRGALDVIANLPDEPAPLAELEVVTDGHRILVVRSDERLVDPVARQYILRLPLAVLLAEVQSGVAPAPYQEVRVSDVPVRAHEPIVARWA